MTEAHSRYTCSHFSLANPEGQGQDDLPELLRRVAASIEEYGIRPIDLLDVTLAQEITADGPWWSATVYWSTEVNGA